MKIHHRLRTKLIAVFFIVTLIPALVTGIYAIQVSSKTLRTLALTTQTEQAKTLANQVTSFLTTVKGDLIFLSQSPVMKDYLNQRANSESPEAILEPKRQALEQEFLTFSRNRRIYYQIRYLDETGQEIARVDSNGLRSRIIQRDKLQDKSGRYYFKKTIRLLGSEVFVSPLDLNRERGQIEKPFKPVIRYAVNVFDNKNRKAGIVIINVDASQFIEPLGDTRLVNQNGYFINHPDPEKRWGGPVDLDTGYNLEREYHQWNQIIQGQDGILSNSTLTLSYKRVNVPGTSRHWTVIIQRETDDILKTVTAFRTMFTVILILAVLIALIVGWLLSVRITRPIEQLTRIADAISKGELISNSVEVQDKGEIGQLAHAFERMRVSMIKAFERLRQQST
jgi:HAMP domain-containing protein